MAFVVVFLSCAKVFAHHGGSEYALNQTVEFKAKLTRVDLINPHSWLNAKEHPQSIKPTRSGHW